MPHTFPCHRHVSFNQNMSFSDYETGTRLVRYKSAILFAPREVLSFSFSQFELVRQQCKPPKPSTDLHVQQQLPKCSLLLFASVSPLGSSTLALLHNPVEQVSVVTVSCHSFARPAGFSSAFVTLIFFLFSFHSTIHVTQSICTQLCPCT